MTEAEEQQRQVLIEAILEATATAVNGYIHDGAVYYHCPRHLGVGSSACAIVGHKHVQWFCPLDRRTRARLTWIALCYPVVGCS